jgi:hypothetical protein
MDLIVFHCKDARSVEKIVHAQLHAKRLCDAELFRVETEVIVEHLSALCESWCPRDQLARTATQKAARVAVKAAARAIATAERRARAEAEAQARVEAWGGILKRKKTTKTITKPPKSKWAPVCINDVRGNKVFT